jgi:hypothetical protein
VAPQTIPAINVLFHAMKQRSQRLRRLVLVPSLLLKGALLVVLVVVIDVVVKVVMGVMTIPILGANVDQMMVLRNLSQMKLQPMALIREMALG